MKWMRRLSKIMLLYIVWSTLCLSQLAFSSGCRDWHLRALIQQNSVQRIDNRFSSVAWQEIEIATIVPIHSIYRPEVPKPPQYIEYLMARFKNEGFLLRFTIKVVRMPDGRLLSFTGHHRTEAMKRLGEKTIPAVRLRWETLDPEVREWYTAEFPDVFRAYQTDITGINSRNSLN